MRYEMPGQPSGDKQNSGNTERLHLSLINRIRNLPIEWRIMAGVTLAAVLAAYIVLRLMMVGVRGKVESQLSDSLKCRIRIESSGVGLDLRIRFRNVSFTRRGEERPFLRVREISVMPQIPALLHGDVLIQSVNARGAAVLAYRRPDGSLNLSFLSDRVGVCRNDSLLTGFPSRIDFSDASIELDVARYGEKSSIARAAGLTGSLVQATGGSLALKLSGEAFLSEFKIAGMIRPCQTGEISIDAQSDPFDFDDFTAFIADALFRGRGAIRRLPGGRGELSLALRGTMDSPTLQGRASLRLGDISFSLANQKLSLTDIRAGVGPEKITGQGEVDLSQANLPFELTFYLKSVPLARLLGSNVSLQYMPEGDIDGAIRSRGSLVGSGVLWIDGKIDIRNAAVRLPGVPFGDDSTQTGDAVLVPLQNASAMISITEKGISVSNITAAIGKLNIAGDGLLAGRYNMKEGFGDGANYRFNLRLNGPVESLVDKLSPNAGLITGASNIRFAASGGISSDSDFAFSGDISVRNGLIRSPFGASGTFPFTSLTGAFRGGKGFVTIPNFDATGQGGRLHGGVSVNDGQISGVGSISVNQNALSFFPSLAEALGPASSPNQSAEAKYIISGAVEKPLITWTENFNSDSPAVEPPSAIPESASGAARTGIQ